MVLLKKDLSLFTRGEHESEQELVQFFGFDKFCFFLANNPGSRSLKLQLKLENSSNRSTRQEKKNSCIMKFNEKL